jgi:hypothetical protein
MNTNPRLNSETRPRLNKMIVRIPNHIVWDSFFKLRGTVRLSLLVREGEPALPPDLIVISVHQNWEHESFDFIVGHPSFPLNVEGAQLRILQTYVHSTPIKAGRREFKKGDTVYHRPSGETWLLIEDEKDGRVTPGGYPPTQARADDCQIVVEKEKKEAAP